MVKNLLCIESNTTGSGMLALRKARELGLHPIFVTSTPDRYAGLQATQCPVLLCETNDYNVLRATIEQIIHIENVCGIFTTSEFYLETVAQLAALYQLEGNTPESVAICRDKSFTRTRLTPTFLQPRFKVIEQIEHARQAAAEIGLPCIVKPVDDSGSNGVRWCSCMSEVEEQARILLSQSVNARGQKTAHRMLLEEYIDAKEYSVEMFCIQGESICLGITEKTLTGFPHFVEFRHVFPAPLPLDVSEEIVRIVRSALATVGITHGATHTEVKLTPQGPMVIEINARLAGGMIPELMQQVLGIDVLAQQIKAASGMEPEFGRENFYERYAGIQFIIAPATGWLKAIHGEKQATSLPGIVHLSLVDTPREVISPPRGASDRLGYSIACASTYEEVHRLLTESCAQLSYSVDQEL